MLLTDPKTLTLIGLNNCLIVICYYFQKQFFGCKSLGKFLSATFLPIVLAKRPIIESII